MFVWYDHGNPMALLWKAVSWALECDQCPWNVTHGLFFCYVGITGMAVRHTMRQ